MRARSRGQRAGIDYGYITSELERVESELERVASGQGAEKSEPPLQLWRHMHWGYFDDPEVQDDSAARALSAAESLTEHILEASGVGDGEDVLDVGCGFGGTLDHIRTKQSGCRLVGVNIDFRQVYGALRLLEAYGDPTLDPVAFISADGCRLPLGNGLFDRVLAIECIFHFPSRKAFLHEAARVLKPGGTLALSDFVIPSGSMPTFVATMGPIWGDVASTDAESPQSSDTSINAGLGSPGWFARSSTYERLSRRTGFQIVRDEDITVHTVPTYAALRRTNREGRGFMDPRYAERDLMNINSMEALSIQGDLQYRVLTLGKI